MPTFTYRGKGALGENREGRLEANSRSEALRLLAREKIQPLSLDSSGDKAAAAREEKTNLPSGGVVRLNQAQIILFTDELGELLHSGLQLEPALQLIENREEKSAVKTVARMTRLKVRDGVSFSEALKSTSPDFGELYCNLISAGELTGALTPLLRRQSAHLLAMQDLRGKIKLALIYPACLVLFGIVAVIVLMTVLVPQMTSLLAKTGTAMPLPTYILVQMATFMRKYVVLVGAGVAALMVLFKFYIGQPKNRLWWDEFKLKIPYVGPMLSASFFAEFCQGTTNLLLNGLPLLTTLRLMSRATNNMFYRSLIMRMADMMDEGSSLTRAMKVVGNFPANLLDLVKLGEQTGSLATTLEKVGVRYEKVMQQRIDQLMALVPVAIISALGALIGLVFWSVLSGIFQAIHGLQGHH